MIRKLHDIGLSSDAAYMAGFSSIGVAIASWISSRALERAGTGRADHWGMFVGLWAPTFMSLGNALRMEEEHEAMRHAARRTAPAAEPVGSSSR